MRVGVVIVTHYRLGEEFLQALRLIVPDAPPFEAVSIDPKQSVEEMRRAIAQALAKVERGQGVLVLTDMFGGTPSNLAISVLDRANVEVIAGINLPMLIKLAGMREGHTLQAAVTAAQEAGRKYINVASQLLAARG
jgi:mannose PTS system EIIA component